MGVQYIIKSKADPLERSLKTDVPLIVFNEMLTVSPENAYESEFLLLIRM